MTDSPNDVYTIGHSNHSIDQFIAILLRQGIVAIADVRSTPYSRFVSHFNRESLRAQLSAANIQYAYVGDVLGGRPSEPECYDQHGRVCYQMVANSDSFQNGLDRVLEGASSYRIALMCSEEDPLDCHRALLIAHQLIKRQVCIHHVRIDGSTRQSQIEAHSDVMRRLVDKYDLNQGSMISQDGLPIQEIQSLSDIIESAVEMRGREIAYVDPGRIAILGTDADEGMDNRIHR